MAGLFAAIKRAIKSDNQAPRPDREVIFANIAKAPDLTTAIKSSFALFAEPVFSGTVLSIGRVHIASHKVQRTFNEAAAEWSRQQNQEAVVPLSCERLLVVTRDGTDLKYLLTYRDMVVRYDPQTRQLKPHRVAGREFIEAANIIRIVGFFPNLTPQAFIASLRHPKASSADSTNSKDAVVAGRLTVKLDDLKKPAAPPR